MLRFLGIESVSSVVVVVMWTCLEDGLAGVLILVVSLSSVAWNCVFFGVVVMSVWDVGFCFVRAGD